MPRASSNSTRPDCIAQVNEARDSSRHKGLRRNRHTPLIGALVLLAALGACTAAVTVSAQTRYAAGQNIVPVFEGWERNPDGSFSMVFGYLNRNYEEELDIPLGPDNTIEPALGPSGADQGQPTHFYTRRQQFVFKVRVPKDWGKKDLVWTLTVRGKTEKAYASLIPFYELGPLVYQENRGATAEIGATPDPNNAPTIEWIGTVPATASIGQPLTLAAKVLDDGRPVPRKRPATAAATPGTTPAVPRDANGNVATPTGTPGPSTGGPSIIPRRENPLTQAMVRVDPGVALGVTWIVYRGPSEGVTIAPQRAAVHDNKAETTVTFAKPGTYTLRAYADDTVYVTPLDITIAVR